MGTLDLYEDGFPHGTKEGFAKGCKGIACVNHGTTVITCKDAFRRFNGDYGFRKLVEAGNTPEEIAQIEADRAAAPAVEVPKLVTVEKPARKAPVAKVPLGHPDFPHGTTGGAQRGCKTDADCPGNADGLSCRQALRDYQRDWRAGKAGNVASGVVAADGSSGFARAPRPAPSKPLTVEPVAVVESSAPAEDLTSALAQLAADRLGQLDVMAGELKTARQELTFAQQRVVELTLELDVAKAQTHAYKAAQKPHTTVTLTIHIGA